MPVPNPEDVTVDLKGRLVSSPGEAPPPQPARIGRYRIEKLIGKGGFGLVYRAVDEQLDRSVAVKIPHANLITGPEDAEVYLAEARTVANLDHPNIVTVHDVGTTDDFPCYIVSKCIEGTDLASMVKHKRLQVSSAVDLVATVAEALHYAHRQGLVHRDVKPGNILIDQEGKPYVVDFGLALREENIGRGPRYVGTLAYMSPEQARGEGHRVDGRSDVFSLGVVLYQLLVGRRPFRGATQDELREQVTSFEPRPLRQYDEGIPKELERICQKALSKRASDRYFSAHDMAEDLRCCLAEQTLPQSDSSPGSDPSSPSNVAAEATATRDAVNGDSTSVAGHTPPDDSLGTQSSSEGRLIKIIPKGLRSFDAQDADFFVELLPGPRDRRGLPESLRFWKSRIEETDSDCTFNVGLIYGPSGCGKSSLVKAGLIPRLSRDVIVVYAEATPGGTESRLLAGIRKKFPLLGEGQSLKESLAALRRGQGFPVGKQGVPVGKKVLVVIDQFEQWLHAKKGEEDSELSQALRQCDGGRVQCMIMVRDDFWLAVSRFLRVLEVRLLEGDNIALADLFDLDHAEKVLAAFGRAFGKLPQQSSETTKDQKAFLEQSVAGLAQEGKVICVRLALFAEMMKGKPWIPTTLKEVGGTKGIGTTFLEETFSSSTASPAHRLHQKAARGVLKALLPETGTNIKGQMKSQEVLMERSGYVRRPKDFADLIEILDSEIRLISPADPEGVEEGAATVPEAERDKRYYQLTHDYLVPSLRQWLTRKQKESRSGRAQLQLAEHSSLWNVKRENRYLPSWTEHLKIRMFTDAKHWTPAQQRMMWSAGRVHGLQTAMVLLLVAVTMFAGFRIRKAVMDQRAETQRRLVEKENSTRARVLVDSLVDAEIAQVPRIISELDVVYEWADPILEKRFRESAEASPEKLHLSMALLPIDRRQVEYLVRQLPGCELKQFAVLRDSLMPHKDEVVDLLWSEQDFPGRFQALAALAHYASEDARWATAAADITQHLTASVSSLSFAGWLDHFRPASDHLIEPLVQIHADRTRTPKQREAAAVALASYLRDDPLRLAEIILVAEDSADFLPLLNSLMPHAESVSVPLTKEIEQPIPPELDQSDDLLSDQELEQRTESWNRRSMAAATLVHLGKGSSVWPLLRHSSDPTIRSFIIQKLGKLRADPNVIASRLVTESDDSIRRALIQCLGGLDPMMIRDSDRERIVSQLKEMYVHDLDAGIHSSASWTLRRWGEALPELPRDSVLTPHQTRHLKELAAEVQETNRLIALYTQHELPELQATWEKELVQHPASLSEGRLMHFALDETGGTEAANSVRDRSAGVIDGVENPKWTPGVIDGSLRLDGKGGHLHCGHSLELDREHPFSLGGWFMLDRRGKRGVLVAQFDDANQRGFAVNVDPVSSEVMIELAHDMANRVSVRGKVSAITQQWHHVLVTYNGTSAGAGVAIYVDGRVVPSRLVADTLTDTIVADVPLHIGMRNVKFPFRGQIDDVVIYDRELKPNDVEQLFLSGLGALARVSKAQRTPEQTSLLDAAYLVRDDSYQRLQRRLASCTKTLSESRWTDTRRWYVNGQGQTMMVIPSMRSEDSAESADAEIDYTFAMSSHEVTRAEFMRHRDDLDLDFDVVHKDDCPIHVVNWYSAARYCNWLSKQEGIAEDQWVYQPNAEGKYAEGMSIKDDYLQRSGYRLPTEAEWEFACRSGAETPYSYGRSVSLLPNYANFVLTSSGRTCSVKSLLPNELGLFDMHGNLWEWTQGNASGPFSPVLNHSRRWLRGGSFYGHYRLMRISDRNAHPANEMAYANGFRPTRTFNPFREAGVEP